MKTQIQPIIAPRGGLNYSLPPDLISETEMSGGQNVHFQDGYVQTRPGFRKFLHSGAYGEGEYGEGEYSYGEGTLPLPGTTITGMDAFTNFSGISFYFVMTEDNIYKADVSNLEWDSYAGSTYGYGLYGAGVYGPSGFSFGTDADLFDYTTVRDEEETDLWWICTNGVDAIKVYKGTGAYIADLLTEGRSLRAKYVEWFKDHLVLAYTTETDIYPQRIRWSDTADPDDFTNGNANYKDLDGHEKIMGIVKIRGDYLAVLRENSLYLGYHTGDSDIFDFRRKIENVGCVAPYTVKNVNEYCVFLGADNVYRFDGSVVEPIGDKMVAEAISMINIEEIERSHAIVDKDHREYWLFVPTSGTYPDTAWIWHWDLQTWSKYVFTDDITRAGLWKKQASDVIDDLIGTIDEQNWIIDERVVIADAPSILLGAQTGHVYEFGALDVSDDGAIIDAWFDTKDLNFTNLMSRVRQNRMDISYTGSEMDVYSSNNEGVDWDLIKEAGGSDSLARKKLSFRNCADKTRFRFRSDSLIGHYKFSRANIFWQKAGRI